jgi:NAD(P)-dependent dehydrogenase (short-subunit alcohol dehydrogenase family)
MESRVIVITGANSGIGRRAAHELAALGHSVVLVCRNPARAAEAVEAIRAATGNCAVRGEIADVADPVSVDALAGRLERRYQQVDSLVNNAAVFDQTATRTVTPAGHERFWATNHLGPFQLTARLAGLLAGSPDARVLTIASEGLKVYPRIALRFDDLDAVTWFTPTKAYYHSKLAQVTFAAALARRVPEDGVLSLCLRVPAVRLDPDRVAALPLALRLAYAPKNRFAASPERLGSTYARLAAGARADVEELHGAYVDEQLRRVRPPRSAQDIQAQDRLWEVSLDATGTPPEAFLRLHPSRAELLRA